MALHLYLYLHAELCADLTMDVTRMARDDNIAAISSETSKTRTGLPVSFCDIRDERRSRVTWSMPLRSTGTQSESMVAWPLVS